MNVVFEDKIAIYSSNDVHCIPSIIQYTAL